MTNPYLRLEGLSYVLPDGRTLFSDLSFTLDAKRTGLVGRNGVGKSILAQLLAGQRLPTDGHCHRNAIVHYLAQHITPDAQETIASVTGLQPALDALTRIELGQSDAADFETLRDRWTLRQRLQAELIQQGLPQATADTPLNHLSGGEAMRIAWMGARLSEATFLILDEPSNHLDPEQRALFMDQLHRWPHSLLLISHDRHLLNSMDQIIELSPQGLQTYGGNYDFYCQQKAQERQDAEQHLEQCKRERQRQEQAIREQRERQERRQSRGQRQGKDANQAKILLGRQKERSESSSGKRQQQQQLTEQRLNQQVRDAAQRRQQDADIVLHHVPIIAPPRETVALHNVRLPFVQGPTRDISLHLRGPRRIGILGPNGCGKSTLLKLLAGHLTALSGNRTVTEQRVYLDQRLSMLDPQRSVLAQLRDVQRRASESDLRMRLAQLDLDAQKINLPSAVLSGGERLKAALACVLYAEPAPQLLLLDEPNNHLDFPSLQALETLLRGYQGALIIVSHDEMFLNQLALTDRLIATEQGWQLAPWE
ncbi:ATP-binding cassette domain-containing protein [Pseudomonas chengduensis]|nr:ABC-F family ATP-binding cassette domain-containing protein [Pseudomonas chengduensis]MDH1866516.1 ATP-binding cassette domain-containing protein [Pseudomonas chengduensis]